ncbi:MAG: ABC transporter ATP-binding protein [Thermodesulfobacteriota bacterium]|nr:ABC transporter ATP-binding protein [Thermodesulfobacteriota bacterium]
MNDTTAENGILDVDQVTLYLGKKRILNDLSISFWPAHIHAVVGPNGAGKSTLASTIMGLNGYGDFEGDVRFKGASIKALSTDERARKGITLAWQEPARFEGLSVKAFVSAGAVDKSDEKAGWALDVVGLNPAEYLDRAVDKTLSGGERKRVELASILTMEPALVMMDEPDSGIDVDALNKIFKAIALLKEKGTTVLMITHSQTVLEQADHAFLLCCGQVVQKGPVDKIMDYFGDKCLPCNHKNQPVPEAVNE